MFKPHYGNCSCCGEPGIIMTSSRGLRKQCDDKWKESRKEQKHSKNNRALIVTKPTGEKEVFQALWDTRERKSFVTGAWLSDRDCAYPYHFSHILKKNKSAYPMFKFYPKNIQFKELREHTLWEHFRYTIKNNPKWKHVFEFEKELIKEYKEHKKLYQKGKVEYYKR